MFRYSCIDILAGKQQDLPEVDIGYCSYLLVCTEYNVTVHITLECGHIFTNVLK